MPKTVSKPILQIASEAMATLPKYLHDAIEYGECPLSGMLEKTDAPYVIRTMEETLKQLTDVFGDTLPDGDIVGRLSNRISNLINRCRKIEGPLKGQLEPLCGTIASEMLGLPENVVNFSVFLDESTLSYKFHVTPDGGLKEHPSSINEVRRESREVLKRKAVNAYIDGIADSLMETAVRTHVNELFRLNDELPHLYIRIIAMNRLLQFVKNITITDREPQQGGYEKVTIPNGDGLPSVEAHGMIFPILLYESFRGLLELCASAGLPDSLGEAENLLDGADVLCDAPWNCRFGMALYKGMFTDNGINPESQALPELIRALSTMSAEDIEEYTGNVLCGTRDGREMSVRLYEKAMHDTVYTSFAGDIEKRAEDFGLISDDECFSVEELDETPYL